jgi:hypothetical protein
MDSGSSSEAGVGCPMYEPLSVAIARFVPPQSSVPNNWVEDGTVTNPTCPHRDLLVLRPADVPVPDYPAEECDPPRAFFIAWFSDVLNCQSQEYCPLHRSSYGTFISAEGLNAMQEFHGGSVFFRNGAGNWVATGDAVTIKAETPNKLKFGGGQYVLLPLAPGNAAGCPH